MRLFLTFVLVLFTFAAVAAQTIYKWTREDGTVEYSDQPRPGAEQLEELAPVQTYDAPTKARPQPLGKKEQAKAANYGVIRILEPNDDTAIRSNNGNVTVKAVLQPGLQAAFGHQLQLLMDGQPVSEPGSDLVFELSNIDRGTHELVVRVLDERGKQFAESKPTVFHLLRVTVGGA